jgi:hypothetical protein
VWQEMSPRGAWGGVCCEKWNHGEQQQCGYQHKMETTCPMHFIGVAPLAQDSTVGDRRFVQDYTRGRRTSQLKYSFPLFVFTCDSRLASVMFEFLVKGTVDFVHHRPAYNPSGQRLASQ